MKNKSSKLYTKKRNIFFKSFSDINLVFTKEVKLESKALINPLKKSYTHKSFHLNKGQIPIFSKNKNIILIVENNYDKKILQGKSSSKSIHGYLQIQGKCTGICRGQTFSSAMPHPGKEGLHSLCRSSKAEGSFPSVLST